MSNWGSKMGIVSSFDDIRRVLADEPTEYEKLLEAGNTPYGLRALVEEGRELEGAEKGFRNDRLNKAACKLGSLIASGNLNEDTVKDILLDACQQNGLIRDDGLASFKATIHGGIRKGKQNPRYPANHSMPETQETANTGGKLTLRRASHIKPERVSWLWDGVLAKAPSPSWLATLALGNRRLL